MNRGRSGGGRLVYVAELYVRSWDLYKPGQATAPVTHTPPHVRTGCSIIPYKDYELYSLSHKYI